MSRSIFQRFQVNDSSKLKLPLTVVNGLQPSIGEVDKQFTVYIICEFNTLQKYNGI